MARDELWIKHDVRSRLDGKMKWFLRQTGVAGYGIFWSIMEVLHYQNDHTIPDDGPEFEGIAEDLMTTPEKLSEVLNLAVRAGLFRAADGRIWQERLKQEQAKRSKTKQNLSEVRSQAGRKGGQARVSKGKSGGAAAKKPENFASNFAYRNESSKTDFCLKPIGNENADVEANHKQTQANRIEEREEREEIIYESPSETLAPPKIPKQKKPWPLPGTEVAPLVYLTDEQQSDLTSKMPVEELAYWIAQLTEHAQLNPAKWKKTYANHSLVIQKWRRMRQEDGKVWNPVAKLYQFPARAANGNGNYAPRKSSAEIQIEKHIGTWEKLKREEELNEKK